MVLQSILSWFLPKDDTFFRLMERQAATMAEAAAALTMLPLGSGVMQQGLGDLQRLKLDGAACVRELMLALDATFVTPIDREDIHSLATQMDEVLELICSAGQGFAAYDVQEKSRALDGMIVCLVEACTRLRDVVPNLRRPKPSVIGPARHQIAELERRSDSVYHAEISALFRNPGIDAKELTRQQMVLGSLDAAMSNCQRVADTLEKIVVKQA